MKFSTLTILLLAAIAATARAEEKFTRQAIEVDGHKAFVILPEKDKIKPGRPTPWVFYAPTFHNKLPSDRDEGWMMRNFLDQGIAIAGVDVGESYGSPAGQKIYSKLHGHLVTNTSSIPKQVCWRAAAAG